MHTIQDIENTTRNDLAELFSVHPSTVSRWVKRDKCPRNKDGSYDLSEVIAWRLDELALSNDGNSETPEAKKWLTEFRKQRAILAKIERKRVEGELMSRDEVGKDWGIRIRGLTHGLKLWSARLPGILYGRSKEEIAIILADEVWILMKAYSTHGRYTPEIAAVIDVE